MVRSGPEVVTLGPVTVTFERGEALQLLALTLLHLDVASSRDEVTARVPLLLNVRDKLADALELDL